MSCAAAERSGQPGRRAVLGGTAYYGSNLGRLREVKPAVDPHNLVTFPQVVQA